MARAGITGVRSRVIRSGMLTWKGYLCIWMHSHRSKCIILAVATIFTRRIQIFTLKPPFSHIQPPAILYRIYSGERHPRPSLSVFPSDQLWELVEQCMSLQPKERPTASNLKHVLAHMQIPVL